MKPAAKTCLILTESFPYPGGDDYLLLEIEAWAETEYRIIIAPARAPGAPFEIPAGVHVDLSLARLHVRYAQAYFALRALASMLLWHDILKLAQIRELSVASALSCFRTVAKTLRSKQGIKRIHRMQGQLDLVYSYWNDTEAFAAALCKKHGDVTHLVSRAHGFDLYAERRPGNYLPVKDQVLDCFDAIFPVSEQGKHYLAARHDLPIAKVHVARLGIDPADFLCPSSPSGSFNVISIAYCVDIKRIDKLIVALGAFATRHPDIQLGWHHIGGGPLLQELTELADSTFAVLDNASVQFVGDLSNAEVLQFFIDHQVDVIVNTSDSEGAPVSLMEAMGCSVPAIAPRVGGIPEMVGDDRGFLINKLPNVDDIAEAMESALVRAKETDVRSAARDFIRLHHDARKNYSAFVAHCLKVVSLAESPSR